MSRSRLFLPTILLMVAMSPWVRAQPVAAPDAPATTAGSPEAATPFAAPPTQTLSTTTATPATAVHLVDADAVAVDALDAEALVTEWQRRCFLYLWEQAEPTTGLVRDRAPADAGAERFNENDPPPASIAATGFALSALPVAEGRGWITREQAYDRAHATLRFLLEDAPHHKGFYYHFVDLKTGRRMWDSELSSIDTALLIAGVLTAGQHFAGTDVERMANAIYERVEWPWMLAGGETLSMGWTPEGGFLPWRWDHYSEHMILQILGLGSPTHPLPEKTWHAWRRGPTMKYGQSEFLSYPPLFVHQFSHAWIDFRGVRDDYADYWHNSILATRAHRRMFSEQLSQRFNHYSDRLWGVTSSDSQSGYLDWGGPQPDARIDGTVVPCASGGSYPFLPEDVTATVAHMKETYGETTWKRYGFADAFNPTTGWVAKDCLGIDVGITLLAIENGQRGTIWRLFMSHEAPQRGMERARFREHHDDPTRLTSLYQDSATPGDAYVTPAPAEATPTPTPTATESAAGGVTAAAGAVLSTITP